LFHNFLLFSKILFNINNNANKNIFASSPEVRPFFDFLWIVSEDAQFLRLRLPSEFFGAHAYMDFKRNFSIPGRMLAWVSLR
jgi:hypothetical protein